MLLGFFLLFSLSDFFFASSSFAACLHNIAWNSFLLSDGITLDKHLVNLRIHSNVKILIFHYACITLADNLFYPSLKWLSDNRKDDIGKIISMKLFNLSLFVWQNLINIRITKSKLKHVVNGKSFKLRNTDVLDIFWIYYLSLVGSNISTMINCTNIVLWQEDATISWQEPIYFYFAFILSLECLGCHSL